MTGQGRHGSKTHTACLTCKKRRVKCGLERPSCARCVKAGRTCDGYQLALVKGVSSRTLKETTPPHLTNSSLLLSPFRATQPEWQAYGYYHQRIASVLRRRVRSRCLAKACFASRRHRTSCTARDLCSRQPLQAFPKFRGKCVRLPMRPLSTRAPTLREIFAIVLGILRENVHSTDS